MAGIAAKIVAQFFESKEMSAQVIDDNVLRLGLQRRVYGDLFPF